MEIPGTPFKEKIQVTQLSTGVLGEGTQGFSPTLLSLYSLRPRHFPSHKTRPVLSNTEATYVEKSEKIAQFSDLCLPLVFNFLHEICTGSLDKCEHYYTVMFLEYKGIYNGSKGDQSRRHWQIFSLCIESGSHGKPIFYRRS